MSPLRVPPDTPGFQQYPDRTPQPVGVAGWLAIIKRVLDALRKRPKAKP